MCSFMILLNRTVWLGETPECLDHRTLYTFRAFYSKCPGGGPHKHDTTIFETLTHSQFREGVKLFLFRARRRNVARVLERCRAATRLACSWTAPAPPPEHMLGESIGDRPLAGALGAGPVSSSLSESSIMMSSAPPPSSPLRADLALALLLLAPAAPPSPSDSD